MADGGGMGRARWLPEMMDDYDDNENETMPARPDADDGPTKAETQGDGAAALAVLRAAKVGARSIRALTAEEVEDVAGDVLVRWLAAVAAGEGPRIPLPWACRCGRNAAVDLVRRLARRLRSAADVAGTEDDRYDPAAAAEVADQRRHDRDRLARTLAESAPARWLAGYAARGGHSGADRVRAHRLRRKV